MLLLPEGQAGEAPETSNKAMLFQEKGGRRPEGGFNFLYNFISNTSLRHRQVSCLNLNATSL